MFNLKNPFISCRFTLTLKYFFFINGECSSAFDKSVISNATDLFNQEQKAKSILNSFVQLKVLFEIKSASLENEVQQSKEERERNKYVLRESKLFQW
jgi:hypothetical protein